MLNLIHRTFICRDVNGTLGLLHKNEVVLLGNRQGLLSVKLQSARVIEEGRGRVIVRLGLRNRRQWSSINKRYASQHELLTHGPHRSGLFYFDLEFNTTL